LAASCARGGVTRQKFPGLGDILAAERGKTGARSARAAGACREVILEPPRGCRTSWEAEAREGLS